MVATTGALAACREAPLEIRAALAPGGPMAGLTIAVLPFDPAALLDSLATRAPTPRPQFPDLERTLAAFQLPADSGEPPPGIAWRALRDSVAHLADSLNRVDRGAPGYAAAYGRFRHLYARLAQRAAERDAAIRHARRDELELVRRARAAADSLRTWERDAYAAFPDLARAAAQRAGRPVRQVTTDSIGIARVALEPGAWWLSARWPHPDNPFLEYQWTVPVRVAGLPVAVPLTARNVETHWRH